MQAVNVGIGGQNNLLVTQTFEIIFDIEATHQVIHLVIYINDVALEIPDVQRLALQHENGLRAHVPAAHDRTGRCLAFRQENHSALAFAFGFMEMLLAILELRNPYRNRLGPLPSQLFDLL